MLRTKFEKRNQLFCKLNCAKIYNRCKFKCKSVKVKLCVWKLVENSNTIYISQCSESLRAIDGGIRDTDIIYLSHTRPESFVQTNNIGFHRRGAPERHYDRCVPGEIKTLSHVACPKAFLQSPCSATRSPICYRRTVYGFDSQRQYVYDIVLYYCCVKRECKTSTELSLVD